MLRRTALGASALALLAVLAAVAYLWRATPKVDGAVSLPGLAGSVRIERDAHGVPTVHAQTARDAFFGLGVVHAQDRLWQLETHRRIGSGRLAEAFGEAALGTDRFLRALGVRRAAQAQWERTPSASREALQAYADGVNAAVEGLVGALPPEFLVLGLKPEPWTPVDSLAWAIMMAWDLGGNWQSELQRLRLAARLPDQRVHELMPPYPGQPYPRGRSYRDLLAGLGLDGGATRLAGLDLTSIAPESGIEGVGSNNWVVAPSRSAARGALLANDPHLKLSAPALWYLARLKAPGLDVAGATMPGVPSIVLGQNDALAWGFTNTAPDVQDLYLEQVDPQRPDHVRTPGGWARMEATEETIRVRGGREVAFTTRRTRHGPVISDAGAGKGLLGDGQGDQRPPYLLSMRWTALDPDADPVGAGLAMMAARDVEGFVNASRRWIAPMQNMVVADRAGRIGFVAAGRVPLRRADNDLHGMFPAPGWDARYDWDGWIDADATPREFDPARGWLATANQRIHDDSYPHPISTDWAAPWRQQRIEAMLQSRERHSLDDLARMQADVTSLAAVHLLPWMRHARPDSPTAEAVQTILARWDGSMDATQPAPLIHWAWIRHLTRLLMADELGGDEGFAAVFPQRSFREAIEGILARRDAWWCDDKSTAALAETCDQINDRAMSAALAELGARFGTDPAAWRWGDAHQAVSEHRPFSQVQPLAPWFELRTPVGGDTYTVNVSRVALKGADPGSAYHSTHGPSLRALYDVAERQRSRVMHSSGQSGLPWLSAYRAFVEPWRRVDYLPLWPEGAAASAGGVLTLAPLTR